MLTANQLRPVAGRSGARDIGNIEVDVILTYLLQLFVEKGIMDHVGFKCGTMLRKMVFGPRGRLSTDLDFTCHTDTTAEDLMLMMLDALDRPYHGISFWFDREKDWYLVNMQYRCHLGLELRVPSLHIVANIMRPKFSLPQDRMQLRAASTAPIPGILPTCRRKWAVS